MNVQKKEPVHRRALICNVSEASESFNEYEAPQTDFFEGIRAARIDYVHNPCASSYLVIIDPTGTSGWKKGFQQISEKGGAGESMHIIILLTESVRDSYLDYLLERGVSFLFCGKKKVDMTVAAEKLRKDFGIREIQFFTNGSI